MFDKLVELFIQFIELFQFFFVVRAYERGLVLRFGKFHRLVEPGLHWRWPFRVEIDLLVNVVPETVTIGPQSLTTKDEQSIIVASVVTYRISDVRTFLLDIEGAHQVIEDSACGTVAQFVLGRTWEELKAVDVNNELTKKVRSLAKRYGVEVLNVQVTDFTRSRSIRLVAAMGHSSHK